MTHLTTSTPGPAPSTPGGGTERRYTVALRKLRAYVHNRRPGEVLPKSNTLAEELHLTAIGVKTALRTLEAEGAVAATPAGRAVLDPTQVHPHDVVLQLNVRDRITTGHYRPGSALPTGLLGHEHGLTSQEVTRALRRLVAQQLVRHDPAGDHGPGYYVTSSVHWPDGVTG